MRKNADLRRAGVTKKRYKGLDQPPRYLSPTLTYNNQRDCTLKAQQQVSILTLCGRVIVPYSGYDRHLALLQQGTRGSKRKRKKGGKGTEPATPKMRKANRVHAQWPFAELHALIAYKAVLAGSLAIKIEAHYTSKACPKCGFTHEDNRPNVTDCLLPALVPILVLIRNWKVQVIGGTGEKTCPR